MKKYFTVWESSLIPIVIGKVVIIGSLLLFMHSCQWNQSPVVCEVGEHELTEEELSVLMDFYRSDFPKEKLRDKVIEEWVNQRLIEVRMKEKLPEVYQNNMLKAEKEATHLHLFELENNYISENLDSTVTDQEIQEYYEKHRENYKTSSFIVKALYLKVPDTITSKSSLKEYFLLKNDKDFDEVKKYGNLYANNFYLGENKWIYFDDLVKEVPMSEEQKEQLIRNRGESTFNIDGFTYFINVLDFRTKTISSPMETEKSIIRTHILKRRVHQLRKEAKETILENVKENTPITYH